MPYQFYDADLSGNRAGDDLAKCGNPDIIKVITRYIGEVTAQDMADIYAQTKARLEEASQKEQKLLFIADTSEMNTGKVYNDLLRAMRAINNMLEHAHKTGLVVGIVLVVKRGLWVSIMLRVVNSMPVGMSYLGFDNFIEVCTFIVANNL